METALGSRAMADLTPVVVVAIAAETVRRAVALAAESLGLTEVPDVAHVCPRCGSDRHGRPFLTGLDEVHLSITRSSGVLVVALADTPVGVDVERADDPRFAEVADVLLHPLEVVADPAGTAITWVRKEALVKAWASGLAVDPRTIRLTGAAEAPALLTAPAAYDAVPTRLVDLPIGGGLVGCVAVVAAADPDVSVVRAASAAPSRGARPGPGP